MTPIQKKAIEQAIKIIEDMPSRQIWAENYKNENELRLAVKKQASEIQSDFGKKYEAVLWLKAVIE